MRISLLCVALLVLVLGGCTENEPVSPRNNDRGEVGDSGKVGSTPSQASDSVASKRLKLVIRPQEPALGDCLQASVVPGAEGITLTWEINGQVVQIGDVDRLCLTEGARGDVVSVTAANDVTSTSENVTIQNAAPVVVDAPVTLTIDGDEKYFEVNPQVEDADFDIIDLSYEWRVNRELREDIEGNRFPLVGLNRDDRLEVRIKPNDGLVDGPAFLVSDIVVQNSPPKITSLPTQNFSAAIYSYQVVAADPEGDPITFNLGEAPEGMSIDAETGMLTWPLQGVSPGDYTIEIRARDSAGAETVQSFSLSLGEPQ
ncbi:MAG: hypothetical protein C0616_00160 [Desulfuromonas sp.]|nr:MAG: hypothetical protein C0616_00160 [Desulfuromonas sp.]